MKAASYSRGIPSAVSCQPQVNRNYNLTVVCDMTCDDGMIRVRRESQGGV